MGNRKGKMLSPEQIFRLEAIGMTWDVRADQDWQERYEEARVFYEAHGSLDIPADYVSSTGKRLDLWIARQRKLRQSGKLKAEQIAVLDRLGMAWQTNQEHVTREQREWDIGEARSIPMHSVPIPENPHWAGTMAAASR